MSDDFNRMLTSLELFKESLGPELTKWILTAYTATDWDWTQSDGCTFASEWWWRRTGGSGGGSKYFPPCVAHDYYCVIANRHAKDRCFLLANVIRKEADENLHRADIAFGLHPYVANVRWFFVRTAWIVKSPLRWLGVVPS